MHLLLDEGCSASAANTISKATPLHMAVKKRSVEIVRALLEYGADPLMLDLVSAALFIYCVTILFFIVIIIIVIIIIVIIIILLIYLFFSLFLKKE